MGKQHAECWWVDGFLPTASPISNLPSSLLKSFPIKSNSDGVKYCTCCSDIHNRLFPNNSTSDAQTTKQDEEEEDGSTSHPQKFPFTGKHLASSNILIQHMHHLSHLRNTFANDEETRWIPQAAVLVYNSLCQMAPTLSWSLLKVGWILFKSYHTPHSIAEYVANIPQRTKDWYRLRAGWCNVEIDIYRAALVSSSVVAYIAQHKTGFIKDPNRFLLRQVHTFDESMSDLVQQFMDRGTASEPLIANKFATILQAHIRRYRPRAIVSVEEVGLQISSTLPNNACSPDLIVKIFDPDTMEVFISTGEMKCRAKSDDLPYNSIPIYYHDQVQHTMDLTDLPESFFICHSSKSVTVERFEFKRTKWTDVKAKVFDYYWSNLYPSVIVKAHNLLPSIEVSNNNDTTTTSAAAFVDPKAEEISTATTNISRRQTQSYIMKSLIPPPEVLLPPDCYKNDFRSSMSHARRMLAEEKKTKHDPISDEIQKSMNQLEDAFKMLEDEHGSQEEKSNNKTLDTWVDDLRAELNGIVFRTRKTQVLSAIERLTSI